MSQFAGISDFEPEDIEGSLAGSEALESPAPILTPGSLAWLTEQPRVDVLGRSLPACHRVPDGSTWSDEEPRTKCALVRPDGRRCGAPATRLFGVCLIHAGGGTADLAAAGRQGAAKLARLKVTRQILGVGPKRAGSARGLARLAAAERAEEVAAALLSPLADRKLSSMERQRAAAVILGETEPLSQTSVELSVPASPEAVAGMDWASMRALAARLLEA